MRRAWIFFSVFVFGSILGGSVLLYGLYQSEMAETQRAFSSLDFSRADQILSRVQEKLDWGKRLPWIFERPLADIRNRRKEISYWQAKYELILSEEEKNVAGAQDPRLVFVVANSHFRAVQKETEKEKVLKGLESAASAYLQTLKLSSSNYDAAFNYEYLLRVADNVSKGKQKLPLEGKQQGQKEKQQSGGQQPAPASGQQSQGSGLHGQAGKVQTPGNLNKLKTHVPLGSEGDPSKGLGAGKGDLQKKKG